MEDKLIKLDEQIRNLQQQVFEEKIKRQADLRVFVIVAAMIFATLGFTNYLSIPREVTAQLSPKVAKAVQEELAELEKEGILENLEQLLAKGNAQIDEGKKQIKKINALTHEFDGMVLMNQIAELEDHINNLKKGEESFSRIRVGIDGEDKFIDLTPSSIKLKADNKKHPFTQATVITAWEVESESFYAKDSRRHSPGISIDSNTGISINDDNGKTEIHLSNSPVLAMHPFIELKNGDESKLYIYGGEDGGIEYMINSKIYTVSNREQLRGIEVKKPASKALEDYINFNNDLKTLLMEENKLENHKRVEKIKAKAPIN